MARLLAAALALACLCLTGGVAHAQDDAAGEDEFARTGWYLGAYGIYAMNAYRDAGVDFDDGGGFNVRLGYREREWLALEAELEWSRFSGDFGIDSDTIIGGVNAKLYPIGGRYQPYALIGVNGMGVIVDRLAGVPDLGGTDWAFRFGAGVDLYTTRHIVVGVEGTYVWGLGDVWEADYGTIGLGVLYRF